MFKLIFLILFFFPLLILAKQKNWVYLILYGIFYAVILTSYN
jgi:asparagine N-glycosylation enzyme membrane subunit Stt3